MNIGVISDAHFKERLGYADHFPDKREGEKRKVMDAIVDAFSDCEMVVFNGDQLNSKHNHSAVIREFISFVERFEDKHVVIVGGNHEKMGTGESALDFMGELKGKNNWKVFIREVGTTTLGDSSGEEVSLTFCPYFHKSELAVTDEVEGADRVLDMLPGGDILFVHHAISGTATYGGIATDLFNEIVLPKERLEEKYKQVVGGHIHEHQVDGRTVVVGSTFTNELGDDRGMIVKLSIDKGKVTVIPIELPCRPILKVENPLDKESKDKFEQKVRGRDAIVKAVITKKLTDEERDDVRKYLSGFSAGILAEHAPNERKKIHFDEGSLDFSVDRLLEMYAKERDVDINKLRYALTLI